MFWIRSSVFLFLITFEVLLSIGRYISAVALIDRFVCTIIFADRGVFVLVPREGG
jgi:hypothetical protein